MGLGENTAIQPYFRSIRILVRVGLEVKLQEVVRNEDAGMLTDELLAELHRLDRTEKLRVVQLLVNELAAEATSSVAAGVEYPIYTPYGNEGAAKVLLDLLNNEATE